MEYLGIYWRFFFRPPLVADFLREGLSRPKILDRGVNKRSWTGGGWDLGPNRGGGGGGVTHRLSQGGEHVQYADNPFLRVFLFVFPPFLCGKSGYKLSIVVYIKYKILALFIQPKNIAAIYIFFFSERPRLCSGRVRPPPPRPQLKGGEPLEGQRVRVAPRGTGGGGGNQLRRRNGLENVQVGGVTIKTPPQASESHCNNVIMYKVYLLDPPPQPSKSKTNLSTYAHKSCQRIENVIQVYK